MYQDIDIFQNGGAAQRDFLDKAVEGYEENVPLLAQIAAGFTPPGVAMDIAAAGKYGRDAYRDFTQGELGSGAMKLGIAGLSGLAAIPLVGELTRFGKEPLKRALMPAAKKAATDKGIASLSMALPGSEVAANMRKIKTEGGIPYLGGFADEVEKLGAVTAKDLNKMLPDYVSGSDIRLVTNPMSKGIASLSDDMLDLKNVLDDVNLSNAEKLKQIKGHPAILKAEEQMKAIPYSDAVFHYGRPDFLAARKFNFPGKDIVGYNAATKELYQGGRSLAYIEQGLEVPTNVMAKNTGEKTATIVIGPPAAGKSAISNPLAIKNNATIIDPDEAKKVFPEFQGGVGGNAVHRESKALIDDVDDMAMARGDNVVYPKVGSKPDVIRNQILDLKDNGYKVNLVLTDLDPDLALIRMNQRFIKKGRLINADSANKYIGKSNETYDILKKEGIADGYGKIDTTTRIGEPKEIFDDTAEIFKDTGL